MSADVARSFNTAGGYEDSLEFNLHYGFIGAGLMPVANTISGTVRLVSNIALAFFNTMKTVAYTIGGIGQWMFSKETTGFDYAVDSLHGLKINVMACAFAIFEVIPIIGNIPHWCFVVMVLKKCGDGLRAIDEWLKPKKT